VIKIEEESQPIEEPEEEENDEDETVEDLATDNQARIDALVEILTKKGIITEEEFEKAYNEQFEDDEGDNEENDEPSTPEPQPQPVNPAPTQ